MLDAPPAGSPLTSRQARAAAWAGVAPRLAATLRGYIAQIRLSLRPATMVRVEGVLREFACWLVPAMLPRSPASPTCAAPTSRPTSCTSPAGPRLAAARLSKISLAEHLGALRTCFERLTEWDGDDVPARVLVFAGDLPHPRRAAAPLPRRRRVHQAAAGRPRRPRPVRPPRRGIPRPHRPAQGRIPRPHRRRRRADRLRLLAARPGRQAAQRPLHPPAPAAQRPARRLARRPPGRPAQPLPVHRTRPPRSARTASTAPSPRPPRPPASGTSPPHQLATPWPPRPSTAA